MPSKNYFIAANLRVAASDGDRALYTSDLSLIIVRTFLLAPAPRGVAG